MVNSCRVITWQNDDCDHGEHEGSVVRADRRGRLVRPGRLGQLGRRDFRQPPIQVIETLTRELADVRRELALQFKRIAQLQADLDTLRSPQHSR